MKTILKAIFWIVVISIFLFSDNKTVSSARNFCATNGKATYDVVTRKVKVLYAKISDKTQKALAENKK